MPHSIAYALNRKFKSHLATQRTPSKVLRWLTPPSPRTHAWDGTRLRRRARLRSILEEHTSRTDQSNLGRTAIIRCCTLRKTVNSMMWSVAWHGSSTTLEPGSWKAHTLFSDCEVSDMGRRYTTGCPTKQYPGVEILDWT